jgi:phage FluMu gp28-like protein
MIFEQEYEAQFVSDAGSVFRGIDDIAVLEPQAPEEGQSYIVGVDLAKHEDFTVLCVINRFKKEMVWMDRFTDIDYNLQKRRIVALSKKYNNAKVIIDSSGIGDPIVEDIKREIFVQDYRMHSMKAKQQLIERLSLFIEQANIKLLKNETLLNELRRYAFTQSSQGYKYSAPKHQHDDCVIALALAVWGLNPGNYEPDDKPKQHKVFNDYL